MQNSDISKIMSLKKPAILPAVYSVLQHFQTTIASVESFSMLRKLLANHRNFKIENVKEYAVPFQ